MNTAASGNVAGIDCIGALRAAAMVAAQAPSIHNTQPWRWRIHHQIADLYADTSRQLHVVDAERRLMVVSCDAALHHARVALAAEGVAADAELLPATGSPDHLARITLTGRTAVTDAAMRRYQMIRIRHTDRRPLLDEPLPEGVLAELRNVCGQFAIGLHPLTRSDVLDLAAAISRAQRDEVADPATRRELDAWTGGQHPAGAGVPDAVIPDRPAQTTVPSRDFGHVGALPISDRHDQAATYALIYGLDDGAGSWIRAGEALSAMWLDATERNVAVLPLSAAVEEPATRRTLHRTLAGLGYAHLAVRLGITDPNQPAAPRTPRLPCEATIEVLA